MAMKHMSGVEALMEVFTKEGVEYIFGIHGATEVYFMDALEKTVGIKYILGLHEVVSAGMAEGYSRASGKVGVLNLHTNSGLAAAMPMLGNACIGGVPLVITAGQQDTRLIPQEPALTGDLVRMARPFTKWATEITHSEDVPMIMHRAFKVAKQAPSGPVFVSLPQNILYQSADFEYEKGAELSPGTCPDPESINTAAELLSTAARPVLFVEEGITKNGALEEIVDFAETIGAPVYQHWMADVNFPVRHPLYMGDLDLASLDTRELLGKADIMIVVGAMFFAQPVPLSKALLPPSTKVIQIDDNPWQIAKNFPVACGIEGNIKTALAQLTTALKKKLTRLDLEDIRKRREGISVAVTQKRTAFMKACETHANDIPIAPTRLMMELENTLPPGTRIVDDCWSSSAYLRNILSLSEPDSYQRSRQGGSIGYGLPGALGVKLGSPPDTPVVAVVGDGSAMWSIQSLWTAAHYDIPVTFIVLANSSYQQVRKMKHLLMGEAAAGKYMGTELTNPTNDFCKLAEGMGVRARRAERPEELNQILTDAFSTNRPNLVEVAVQRYIK